MPSVIMKARNKKMACASLNGLKSIQVDELNTTHVKIQWKPWDDITYCNELADIMPSRNEIEMDSVTSVMGVPIYVRYGSDSNLVTSALNSYTLRLVDFLTDISIHTKVQCMDECIETRKTEIPLKTNITEYPLIDPSIVIEEADLEVPTDKIEKDLEDDSLKKAQSIAMCQKFNGFKSVTLKQTSPTQMFFQWSFWDDIDYCNDNINKTKDIAVVSDGIGTSVYIEYAKRFYAVRSKANAFQIKLKQNEKSFKMYAQINCQNTCVDTKKATIQLNSGTLEFPFVPIEIQSDNEVALAKSNEISKLQQESSAKNLNNATVAMCENFNGMKTVELKKIEANKILVKWTFWSNARYCLENPISNSSYEVLSDNIGIAVYIEYADKLYAIRSRSNLFTIKLKDAHKNFKIHTQIDCEHVCVNSKQATIDLVEGKNEFNLEPLESILQLKERDKNKVAQGPMKLIESGSTDENSANFIAHESKFFILLFVSLSISNYFF